MRLIIAIPVLALAMALVLVSASVTSAPAVVAPDATPSVTAPHPEAGARRATTVRKHDRRDEDVVVALAVILAVEMAAHAR